MEPVGTVASRVTRWFRGIDPWVIDAVLGVLATVLGVVSVVGESSPAFEDADALAIVLALVCGLPFFVRRRAPLAVHVVVTVGVVLIVAFGYQANLQSQLLIITSYTIGAHCSAARGVIGMLVVTLGVVIVAIIGIPDADTAGILFADAFYVASYFFGTTVRNRRLYSEQLEARAEALERERDEEAQRAVAEERLRIAQELHDVVAHSMGVIAVQAGVGAHVIDSDPVEAKQSLEAIAQTSRTTLTEIRRMLGVLREDTGAEYAPAPGLGDLDRLVRDVSSAGVPVEVRYEGERCELPPGVDFTAYRIIQESLTNVLKHAGPAHATVVLAFEPDALRVAIVDDGRGVNGHASDGGHGLMGMRERTAVYGGSFRAGPAAGGGFAVEVTLPYGADA